MNKKPRIIWRSFKSAPKLYDQRLIYCADESFILELYSGKDALGKNIWEKSYGYGKVHALESVIRELIDVKIGPK